jgi:hypothetical protein
MGLGAPCTHIQARDRSAADVLSATQNLSAGGQFANFSQVAVDQGGDAVFAWERADGTTQCQRLVTGGSTGCLRIQARARSAEGTLSPVQILSAGGEHALYPQVAVDQSDDAVFVWQRYDGTTQCPPVAETELGCARVQARARSAAGVLSAVQTLSAPGQNAGGSQVGVDQAGNAVADWARFDGAYERIQAATGP